MRWDPISPAWLPLYRGLPEELRHRGLSALLRYFTRNGIGPADVTQAAFDNFRVDRMAAAKTKPQRSYPGAVCRYWNQASKLVPGWPPILFSMPRYRRPLRYRLIETFPLSFQAEYSAYMHWFGEQYAEPRGQPSAPYRPRTVRLMGQMLRICSSVLVDSGRVPLEHMTSLRLVVAPAHAQAIVDHCLDRAGYASNYVRDVAMTILAVGRDYLELPQDQLAELVALRRRLGKRDTNLGRAGRSATSFVSVPANRQALLRLPGLLAAKASESLCVRPKRAVHLMQGAIATELLLMAPVPTTWLAELRLDSHIVRSPAGYELRFPEHEAKTGYGLVYLLPDETGALLDQYLEQFRPRFNPGGSPWLFIRRDGERRSSHDFYGMVSRVTGKYLGVPLPPASFRPIALSISMEANPNCAPLLQKLLAHRGVESTIRIMKQIGKASVTAYYDAMLEKRVSEC